MSQKLALVAAAAVATVQAKGFCATLGGLNICNEQVEAALESEKINITGCVTIAGVQVCKNSEESSALFDEESQGFCVEYKGIKVCNEEIEAALESEKINITGCVTIAGVQVCKNSEESVFEEEQKFKIGKALKKVGGIALKAHDAGLFEEEEEQKFKLGKALKKVGGVVLKAHDAGLFEEEAEEQKFKIGKALKKVGGAVLKAHDAGLFEEEGCNMLGCPDASYRKYLENRERVIGGRGLYEDAESTIQYKKYDQMLHRAQKIGASLLEEEEQGFCVEWNGIKVCKEQIDVALDSQKINITGCVNVGGVQICKNSEETSTFDEEQGFCVEWNGIKVCKEEIDAALESEGISISGCVVVKGVKICGSNEVTALEEETAQQGFFGYIKSWFVR